MICTTELIYPHLSIKNSKWILIGEDHPDDRTSSLGDSEDLFRVLVDAENS